MKKTEWYELEVSHVFLKHGINTLQDISDVLRAVSLWASVNEEDARRIFPDEDIIKHLQEIVSITD